MQTVLPRRWHSGVIAALLGLGAVSLASAGRPEGGPAPEFTHRAESEWLNSKPLSLADLKGSVVIVDFWAFECWNCYRSFPWLNAVEDRYEPRGLRVIGVHTPELPAERQRDLLVGKIAEYHLRNPVMLDNDYSYWNAFNNQAWPAFYLIDRKGVVRGSFIGETHAGDPRAKEIEAAIEKLLAEPA